MITLYGIKNCDTVKKAKTWLKDNQIDYDFHDFRVDGLEKSQVKGWITELGWETLVNKRSTTWKNLEEATRQSMTASSVIPIIIEQPTLIKRPLLDAGELRTVGFKAAEYQTLLLK